MEEKFGKLWALFDIIRQIALGLDGISNELKRSNDLQESRLKTQATEKIKTGAREKAVTMEAAPLPPKAGKRAAPKKVKRARTPKGQVPEILFDAVMAVSKEKQEFLAREVITHAMQSAPGAFQKQSLNTALQGFKIGSKTAARQPEKCRDLIIPVEGQRGLYRLNPDKALPTSA